MGVPKYGISLTQQERNTLQPIIRKHTAKQNVGNRLLPPIKLAGNC